MEVRMTEVVTQLAAFADGQSGEIKDFPKGRVSASLLDTGVGTGQRLACHSALGRFWLRDLDNQH